MTPEDVADVLKEWVKDVPRVPERPGSDVYRFVPRRAEYVEPEGPRRTWVLVEDGRQVGMVQGRMVEANSFRLATMIRLGGEPDLHVDSPVYGDIVEEWTWGWFGVAKKLAPQDAQGAGETD